MTQRTEEPSLEELLRRLREMPADRRAMLREWYRLRASGEVFDRPPNVLAAQAMVILFDETA